MFRVYNIFTVLLIQLFYLQVNKMPLLIRSHFTDCIRVPVSKMPELVDHIEYHVLIVLMCFSQFTTSPKLIHL